MLISYNNDVEFRNRWYHIQTEDNGMKDGHITTNVFYKGQTLDSKRISYLEEIANITDPNMQNEVIKALMIKQHQTFYGKLTAGTYEELVSGGARANSISGSAALQRGPEKAGFSSPTGLGSSSGALGGSRPDIPVTGAAQRGSKPDILRASSQQAPGVSKNLDLKALSGKSSSVVPPIHGSHGSGYVPVFSPAPSGGTQTEMPAVPRQPALKRPLGCSRAVENKKKRPVHRAYRGVAWGDDDLSVDSLVAVLLENGEA